MLNKFRSKINNNRGFTLIELIVVMAVIAILVLLATPKFLGYTKDAKVTAMKADCKVLSNAALQYNIDEEGWPVTEDEVIATEGLTAKIGSDATIKKINKSALDNYVKNTSNPIEDYVLVVDGEYEGEVFHLKGVEDKDENIFYGAYELNTESEPEA